MSEQLIFHTVAPRLKFARAIVFSASFCLMTVELVAGRVMAPYLGVSLYTWTAVIGAILLGVTLGNYAGGRLADWRLSRPILGACFGVAGLAMLVASLSVRAIGTGLSLSSLSLPWATAIFCLTVFFPIALCLSLVSPQVIRFDLHDLEHTGLTVGTLGAWSAAGSILGTFATGYIFIMFVGTHILWLALAGLLILIGLSVALQAKLWRSSATPPIVSKVEL
jgi:MFS family permease